MLFVTLAVASAGSVTTLDAKSMQDSAIKLATAGKLQEALSMFQEAVNLDGSNPRYFNNLGVTQMRLHLWEEAEKTFLHALELDSGSADASDNLAELYRYRPDMKRDIPAGVRPAPKQNRGDNPTRDPHRLERVQRHNPKPLPRIHIKDLYKPENYLYADGLRAFVLVGAMDKWKVADKWQPHQLQSEFSSSIVDFYPHNMHEKNTHPFLVSMEKAINEFYNPSGEFPHNEHVPGQYIQWNINTTDWAKLKETMGPLPYAFERDEQFLEECLEPDLRNEFTRKLHWRMLLVGTENAGMFNHIGRFCGGFHFFCFCFLFFLFFLSSLSQRRDSRSCW